MSTDIRYDFILLKLTEGTDPAAAVGKIAAELGAKPEKIQLVLEHIRDKGPVAIEKGASLERVETLKRIWESAGVATSRKEALTVLDSVAIASSRATYKCPACGAEQVPQGENSQCVKCGVFPHKFLEQQKKQELYLREKEKLERIHGFRKMKEDKEAREAAEAAELEAVRKRIEEEMGLNKKPGRFAWLFATGPGARAARTALGGAALVVLLLGGWYGRDLFGSKTVTTEELARFQAAQSKQNATQMQNMVGNLIKGSKQMAIANGTAAQFKQELFAQGDRDPELAAELGGVQTAGSGAGEALSEEDRTAGLSGATRTFAESGGNIEDAERALDASMHSAQQIKDTSQRVEAVNAVAGSKLEVYSRDARDKASTGDWRGADRSFSKALSAAAEVDSKGELAGARSTVARIRADTGDYGGAMLLFMESLKAAEELPTPRTRALAIAGVARQMAQATNDLDGAAGRAFDKAFAILPQLTVEAERAALTGELLTKRVQAGCKVAGFLYATDADPKEPQELLARAAKDADLIADPLLQAGAIGEITRVSAEFQGRTEAVNAQLARLAKMPPAVAEPARERVAAATARVQAEVMAAAARFVASKGDKAKAKLAFLAALKATGPIATKSRDPLVRSEIARHRTEALGTIARYMQAAGDRQAASRVFQLALKTADPAQAPKVLSMMVLSARGG